MGFQTIILPSVPKWNIEEFCGYKPITTFWEDFSVAECFGTNGVRDTFNRAFSEWKTNFKYLTELVMVMSHKACYWYGKNEKLQDLYTDLYYKADEYAIEHLEGKEREYYFRTTD